jgi:hypothetical protein
MKCIKWQAVDGTVRVIPMGVAFKRLPGEKPIGREDCKFVGEGKDRLLISRKELKGRPVNHLSEELDKELGSGLGDMIKVFAAPIAKLLGKGKCSSCNTRRVITNAYGKLKEKHGQLEALRIMKRLWKDTFDKRITEAEVLKSLRLLI